MKKMKKGFTIVELVIVIGVIAILSAVLIPTFATLSNKAKTAKTQSEVTDTFTQYVIDKGDKANAQTDVCIVDGESKFWVFTSADGWHKVESNPNTDANPKAYGSYTVHEKTDTDAA